jgi:hypothetical protein
MLMKCDRNCGHTGQDHFTEAELGFGKTLAERMNDSYGAGEVEDCWVETCLCVQFVPGGIIQ